MCLEEYEYPCPVMTVVLMHGKAFGCYYFRNVIEALTGAGYRVIAPCR